MRESALSDLSGDRATSGGKRSRAMSLLRRSLSWKVVAGIVLVMILGRLFFPPPSGAVSTIGIGYIGQGSIARAEIDFSRELVLLSGGGIKNEVVAIHGDRLLMQASALDISIASDPWVSVPVGLVLDGSFPRTFEEIRAALVRGTKHCDVAKEPESALLGLLMGFNALAVGSYQICGLGIDGGHWADGRNLRTRRMPVHDNAASKFNLDGVVRAEDLGDVNETATKIRALIGA
jgi:hypothetical protein